MDERTECGRELHIIGPAARKEREPKMRLICERFCRANSHEPNKLIGCTWAPPGEYDRTVRVLGVALLLF